MGLQAVLAATYLIQTPISLKKRACFKIEDQKTF